MYLAQVLVFHSGGTAQGRNTMKTRPGKSANLRLSTRASYPCDRVSKTDGEVTNLAAQHFVLGEYGTR